MFPGGLFPHKDENGVVSIFAIYHSTCEYKYVEMLRDGAWIQVGLLGPEVRRRYY